MSRERGFPRAVRALRPLAPLALFCAALASLPGCLSREPGAPGKAAEERIHGLNSFQVITGGDTDDERSRWDVLYRTRSYVTGKEPTAFLRKHLPRLPVGRALVFPLEEGRNGVFLARNGFRVEGIDFSEVALQKAKRLARENGVGLTTINADLNVYQVEREAYDLIANIDFHRPRLVQQIRQGLKPGGVVLYLAPTIDQIRNVKDRVLRRENLLERGELRRLFADYEILAYEEKDDGAQAVASLIARKP